MSVLPKASSRGVEFLRFYSVRIFVPASEKLPSLPGTEIPIFVFFVFCGLKLLRACLKASALTGYVGDAQGMHQTLVQMRSDFFDEGQITHLICARLKYDLYDFFRGCFWAFSTRKRTGSRPKTPPKKSHIDHILGGHRLDE